MLNAIANLTLSRQSINHTMHRIIKKMVLGDRKQGDTLPTGTIDKRIKNIQAIWNNNHQDDVGIEKIFRLFLASSQFLFPGIYIKHIFGKKGSQIQDLAMDAYILVKVILPFLLLYFQNTHSHFILGIVIWLLAETILYVPTLIFASDTISSPSSYRRSMLLLFLNYLEIILAYAMIYAHGNYLNKPIINWYDSIYFSFTTLATIGFGDYYPATGTGKFLVCTQSLIFLAFVVLFINYYSTRVEPKGYFDRTKKD